VDPRRGYTGLIQGFFDDSVDPFGMLAAGYFGNYAVIYGMKRNLRGHHIGKDIPPVLNKGGGAFIAGGLNPKNYPGPS
jgi:hypothetical protein